MGVESGGRSDVEHAINHAAKPDCGAGAVFGVVVAEGQQFGDVVKRRREEGAPFGFGVGPEDGGGGDLAAGRRGAGAQAAGEVVEGGGGGRSFVRISGHLGAHIAVSNGVFLVYDVRINYPSKIISPLNGPRRRRFMSPGDLGPRRASVAHIHGLVVRIFP